MWKVLLILAALVLVYCAYCKVTNTKMLGWNTSVGMFNDPNAEPRDQNLEVG